MAGKQFVGKWLEIYHSLQRERAPAVVGSAQELTGSRGSRLPAISEGSLRSRDVTLAEGPFQICNIT